jgi:CheY-like chemotaxis protein
MQHDLEEVQHPTEQLQQNCQTQSSQEAVEQLEIIQDRQEEKRTISSEVPTWPVYDQSASGGANPPLRPPSLPQPAMPRQPLSRTPSTPQLPSILRPHEPQTGQRKIDQPSSVSGKLGHSSSRTSLDTSTSVYHHHKQTEKSKIIMVVDDSQTVRNIMALILNRSGYRSVRVASAMEALQTLTELTPDLIFLDITLPGMDGLDVCKIIKENPRTKQVPVIMLSGNNEVFDKVMGRLAGASDYITKPFEPESILKCIHLFLGKKDNHREVLWKGTR